MRSTLNEDVAAVWESVKYVSSGLTLVAFLGAVIGSILKARWAARRGLVESAPEVDRAKIISLEEGSFDVETKNLTRDQQYQIAIAQIHARAGRFRNALIA